MNVLESGLSFFRDLIKSRKLIAELTKRDFSAKFAGSFFGTFWAFVHPTITILIFWFVFQVGFRTTPIDNYPYSLWLISGIIPWFFFADSFGAGSSSIVDNSFLVKKVVFRVSVLPIIKLFSALIIHLFFILVMIIVAIAYGYHPDLFQLQVVYYLFCEIVLLLGLNWLTSSIFVYVRDMGQIISILIQFGFWLTPIFWNIKLVPAQYVFIFKLNPMIYIVEGYRESILYKKWFWEDFNSTLIFWIITICVLAVGAITFRRLRPNFSDVI